MKNFEFRTITPQHIPSMSSLLLERQEQEAGKFPFLKNGYLGLEQITDKLQKLLATGQAIGVGAFAHGELVGYLVGMIRIDTRSGRCAVVPYEGVAIGCDQPAELIRYLYTEVSVRWLEHGCFAHSAVVPLANPLYLGAFLQLSFGIEQVHGVLHIGECKPFDHGAPVEIRIATEKDQEVMGQMSSIISKHQNAAPVFIPAFPEVLGAIREGFQSSLEDKNIIVLLAEEAREPLGFHMYEIIPPGLMTPDSAVELCVAGTLRSHMGRGVGKSLMNDGARMMKEKGYSYIITDWRITNLASSTFWPKCGFRPIANRMARFIDPNYAWANLNNPCIEKF